jgi:hypothetical protein
LFLNRLVHDHWYWSFTTLGLYAWCTEYTLINAIEILSHNIYFGSVDRGLKPTMFMLWVGGYVSNSWLNVVLRRVCISCYAEHNTFWVTWQRRRCVVSIHQMSMWIIARSLEGSMMQMGKFNLPIKNSSPVIMSWFALKTWGIVHFFL